MCVGQVTQHQIDWDSHRAVEADHSDVDLGITTFCCVGSLVVSGHCDHLVRVWDANTGELHIIVVTSILFTDLTRSTSLRSCLPYFSIFKF